MTPQGRPSPSVGGPAFAVLYLIAIVGPIVYLLIRSGYATWQWAARMQNLKDLLE